MSFEVCFTDPWLDSVAEPNPQVPQFMEVTIAGRAYVMDTSFEPYRRDAFRHRSIQSQRESINLDNIAGEGTVNTEGLWRRGAVDWHLGAGQPYQDRKDSLDARFSTSKGVNPWMQWQLELLNDTEQVFNLNGENAQVVQAGGEVYVLVTTADTGSTLYYSADLVNWHTLLAFFGNGSITTDGFNVWVSNTEGGQVSGVGIYTFTAGSTTVTPYVAGQSFDGIYFVGERLMATWENTLYNITTLSGNLFEGTVNSNISSGSTVTSITTTALATDIPTGASVELIALGAPTHTQVFTTTSDSPAGSTTIAVTSATAAFLFGVGSSVFYNAAAPTPLWTHPTANFRISSMCAGSSQIYLGGLVEGGPVPLQSVVYRTTIEATGTALTIPVQALPMEGGEYVTGLYGYLNYIFVGSNLGVRMCRTIAAYDPTGNEGDLEAGPLLPGLFPPGPVNSPVSAMVGNNRFVYFGWSDYDTVSTGLGRLDLSTFIDTQAPAFASDLMVTGQGYITSMDWCTINNQPIFVVDGLGVYTATGAPVGSGYVESGYIGYGIPDSKVALAGLVGTVQPQSGNVAMALAADLNANIFALVGNQSSAVPSQSILPINATRASQYTVRLTLTPGSGVSPVVDRWMLKSIPAVTAGTTVSVVLRMWITENIAGQDYYFDPYVEKAFLENLRVTQSVFAYAEGADLTYPYCTVDEIDWLPEEKQDATVQGGYQGNLIVYIKTYDLGA